MEGKNITIIGCGNLGQAILKGLIKSANNVNLVATKRDPDAIKHFEKEGVRILGDNIKAIENADLILLALKPYNVLEVLKDLAPHIDATKQVVVSLATGVLLSTLRENVQSDVPIYRAMPNTAADVAASMTCIASNHSSHDALIEACFNTIGSTIRIDEKLMDAATVLHLSFVLCAVWYKEEFKLASTQKQQVPLLTRPFKVQQSCLFLEGSTLNLRLIR
jgi:pyrroline-5-carboxylate reductase